MVYRGLLCNQLPLRNPYVQKLEKLGVDEHTIRVKVDEMHALQSNTAGVSLCEIPCAGVSQTRVSN